MKEKIVCITCADKHLIPTKSPIKPHWTGSCRCERCGELKSAEFLRYTTERFTVYLTYFKPNGKFYATGKFEVDPGRPIHEIFDLVQEKAVAQVKAGIEATGGAAGLSLQRLQQAASDLQSKTLFGDEQICTLAARTILCICSSLASPGNMADCDVRCFAIYLSNLG